MAGAIWFANRSRMACSLDSYAPTLRLRKLMVPITTPLEIRGTMMPEQRPIAAASISTKNLGNLVKSSHVIVCPVVITSWLIEPASGITEPSWRRGQSGP